MTIRTRDRPARARAAVAAPCRCRPRRAARHSPALLPAVQPRARVGDPVDAQRVRRGPPPTAPAPSRAAGLPSAGPPARRTAAGTVTASRDRPPAARRPRLREAGRTPAPPAAPTSASGRSPVPAPPAPRPGRPSGWRRRPSQVSVAAALPVSAAASSVASVSCFAYACGIAAALHPLRGHGQRQPRVARAPRPGGRRTSPAAYTGSMICSGVPQPCEGRCWKRPSESRSPWSMLRSPDSCRAVASAMVTARSGSPREVPTAAIVAAFAACSGVNSYVAPPAGGRDDRAARRPRAAGDVLHGEIAGQREQDERRPPRSGGGGRGGGSGATALGTRPTVLEVRRVRRPDVQWLGQPRALGSGHGRHHA